MSIQLFSAIIRAVQSPVVLQKEALRTARVQGYLVHALPELGIFLGHEQRPDATILRSPGLATILGPVHAPGGDADVNSLLIRGVENDRVQREPTVARHPAWAVRMVKEPADEGPRFSRVFALKQGRGFDSAVQPIGLVGRTGGDLPDVLEGHAGFNREADRSLLWIGPALAKIIAGAQKGSPETGGRRPDAALVAPTVVRQRVYGLSVEKRTSYLQRRRWVLERRMKAPLLVPTSSTKSFVLTRTCLMLCKVVVRGGPALLSAPGSGNAMLED